MRPGKPPSCPREMVWVCSCAEFAFGRASEGLPQAEEKIEVPAFAHMRVRSRLCERVVVDYRVNGRVQVIAEVQPYRPDRRMVTQADSRRVGKVVEAARSLPARRGHGAGRSVGVCGNGQVPALIALRLANTQGALPRIRGVSEDVAHIVEEHEADRIAQ